MEKFESIKKETVESRPEVFSHKSFPAVWGLARRLDRLKIPVTAEEKRHYEEKYGKAPAVISQEELQGIKSFSALRELVERRSAKIISDEVAEILTTGEKSIWKENDVELLKRAAAEKRFDGIDQKRNALMTTALGLSLVAERARTDAMSRALDVMPEEKLEGFGMSTREREILQLILHIIPKLNAEYLRHRIHIRDKDPYSDKPVDMLRERRFISTEFFRIIEQLKELGTSTPVFGSPEKDAAFGRYLQSIAEAYAPFESEGVPLSRKTQAQSAEKVQNAFLSLHTNYPDFPMIVFPAFSHYEANEASEESEVGWENFGFDPELRIYWQTKEQREKQPVFHTIRDSFAQKIEELYPGIPTDDIKKYRVLVGEPIASSGINIKESTTAQEEKNIVLMTAETADQRDFEAERFFKTLLEDENDIAIADRPAFRSLIQKEAALHEFGHGLYPEASSAAHALGDLDDDLCEKKSDIAMWIAAVPLLKAEAERDFPGKGERAIQLAMIYDALRLWRGVGRSEFAYALSSHSILEVLVQKRILYEKDGKPVLDTEKLDSDCGEFFQPQLAEILKAYQQAATGNPEEIKKAEKAATALSKLAPVPFLKKLKK